MFEQIKLPYAYDALEPYVDALTMETHYSKHHATYTNALNAAAEKAGVAGQPIEHVLSSLDSIDESLRSAIRNNGGGFYNHNLYFSIMSPTPAAEPTGVLRERIEQTFGNVDELKAQLKNNYQIGRASCRERV